MSALKAETRCRHLAREIRPLASFFEQFRPSVRRIRIRREDFNLLQKEAAIARAHGFTVDEEGVHYRRFEIAPSDIAHE